MRRAWEFHSWHASPTDEFVAVNEAPAADDTATQVIRCGAASAAAAAIICVQYLVFSAVSEYTLAMLEVLARLALLTDTPHIR